VPHQGAPRPLPSARLRRARDAVESSKRRLYATSRVTLPPRRDPRSEPGEVPLEEVLGRTVVARVRPGSDRVASAQGDEEPRSDTRPLSERSGMPDTAEEDLLAELAGQLLREERARRSAEERVRALEGDLVQADALRDRAVDELRAQLDALRIELNQKERSAKLELERTLAEAHAEIAILRARRSPSVRAMAAASQKGRETTPPFGLDPMAVELAAVKRTADEALSALKDLIQRKEVVLAEGRAILERLSPTIRAAIDAPLRPSKIPTPQRGLPVPEPSDWPELILDDEEK